MENFLLEGAGWHRIDLPGSPPILYGAAVSYDRERDRAVLIGRPGPAVTTTETWELDDQAWTRRDVPTTLGLRIHAAVSYRSADARVVVVGGFDPNLGYLGDVLSLEASGWNVTMAEAAPPPMFGQILCYDRARRLPVASLGIGQGDVAAVSTWELHPTGWSRVTSGSVPWSASGGTATFVSFLDGCLTFSTPGPVRDTYILRSYGWEALPTANAPEPRFGYGLATDEARGRVVLFGGDTGPTQMSGDTWEYDGADWTHVVTTDSPAPRSHPLMVYDPARELIVLTGGWSPEWPTVDTWEYDGHAWTERPTERPYPCGALGLVKYDADAGQVQAICWGDGALRLAGLGANGWDLLDTVDANLKPEFGDALWDPERSRLILTGPFRDDQPTAETWVLAYSSTWPDEDCANGVDDDSDGLVDDADPDCDLTEPPSQ